MTDKNRSKLLPALVLMAMLLPSVAFFLSRRDYGQELGRVSAELDGTRRELAAERAEDNCERDLEVEVWRANMNWSLRFNDFVIGLSIRGDIPTLTTALQSAGTGFQEAFAAYEARTGC